MKSSLKGKENNELIGFADFYSTLSELTGGNETRDGLSFLPVLNGKKYDAREMLTIHYDPLWGNNSKRRGRFVRDKRYKLYHDGRFYDIKNDILELSPLDKAKLSAEQKRIYNKMMTEHANHPVWK